MKIPSPSGYRKLLLPCALALVAALVFPGAARAQGAVPKQELHVAAAADLQPVMPALAAAYEKKTGVQLVVSFGSSSALATQITNGAPFDVFFGADFVFPEQVVAAGLANEKLPVPYAKGTLVLWARKDFPGPLHVEQLSEPRVTRIAVADEFHAPYGRAAYAALRRLRLLDTLRPKLVVGENVGQTAQFVESGNAQIGLISLTLASSERFRNEGQYALVPKVYPEIVQTAVTLRNSPRRELAAAFLAWMQGPEVQGNLQQFGLEPVR